MSLIEIFSQELLTHPAAAAPDAFFLHDLGLLSIEGSDASKFLQGQITADVEAMVDGQIVLAGHCDHKGRLVSNFFLLKKDACSFFLVLQTSLCEIASKAFSKYAVFSKCSITDHSSDIALLAFFDRAKCQTVAKHCERENGVDLDAFNSFEMGDTDFANQFLLLPLQSPEQSNSLSTTLKNLNDISIAPPQAWHQRRLNAGIALLSSSTTSDYIPQMLNMDSLGAISWTKGCYTGQEIIARMKYRGKSNRRLFVVNWCDRSTLNSDQVHDLKMPATIINSEGTEIGTLIEQAELRADNPLSEDALGLAIIKLKSLVPYSDTKRAVFLGESERIPVTLRLPNYISTDEIFDDGTEQ